jgi:hypothetical protein
MLSEVAEARKKETGRGLRKLDHNHECEGLFPKKWKIERIIAFRKTDAQFNEYGP